MNTDSKQSRAGIKQFLCYTDPYTVLFWSVTKITFRDLWRFLKDKLWCISAVLLDSWWSRTLLFNWEYKRWPGRNVMDAIVIIYKPIGDIEKVHWPIPGYKQSERQIGQITWHSRAQRKYEKQRKYEYGNLDEPVKDAVLIIMYKWIFDKIDEALSKRWEKIKLRVF